MSESRSIGSIANFRVITTETVEEGSIPGKENDYSLPDLYIQLKQLRNLFRPENLEYVEGLITRHIHDFNNPHQTDLENMGTSVIQELYKVWLSEGNVGEREEFLKILFQYVEIADVFTMREGTSLDKVPSVKAAATAVSDHNTDPNAHDVLFNSLFPGEEVRTAPTLSVNALVGLPRFATVVRAGEISYIDEHGFLQTAPENILPSDYINGDAMFPIFGNLTNELLYSENFLNPYWTTTNGSFEISDTIASPRRSSFAHIFKEAASETPEEHTFDPFEGVEAAVDEMYSISLFVAPAGRHCVGIRFPQALMGSYPYVHFNLETEEVFINGGADNTRIAGHITKLACGFHRVTAIIKIKNAGTLIPEFYPIDIHDGDANYRGQEGLGIAVFGAQLTKNADICPYIRSDAVKGTLSATTLTVPIGPWYDVEKGTFVFETANISKIVPQVVREGYTFAKGTSDIALSGKFPTNHAGRFYFTSYDNANTAMISKWSVAHTEATTIVSHGYSPTLHRFGYFKGPSVDVVATKVINPRPTTLNIGTDRFGNNHLNGWVKRFTYYPNLCTPGNIQFFLGE